MFTITITIGNVSAIIGTANNPARGLSPHADPPVFVSVAFTIDGRTIPETFLPPGLFDIPSFDPNIGHPAHIADFLPAATDIIAESIADRDDIADSDIDTIASAFGIERE